MVLATRFYCVCPESPYSTNKCEWPFSLFSTSPWSSTNMKLYMELPSSVPLWHAWTENLQFGLPDANCLTCPFNICNHRSISLCLFLDAARDGRLEVVKQLVCSHVLRPCRMSDVFMQLAYGARPDYRDNNSHTSIWFALQHPQVLWLCENAVRRHRTLECQVRLPFLRGENRVLT